MARAVQGFEQDRQVNQEPAAGLPKPAAERVPENAETPSAAAAS